MTILSTVYYDYDTERLSLTRRSTHQSLACIPQDSISSPHSTDVITLRYQDPDLSVQMTLKDGKIDLNPCSLSYGAWRRLVFFLADAFPVASFMEGHPTRHLFGGSRVQGVILTGGWQNGTWVADVMIQVSVMNSAVADPLEPPLYLQPDHRFTLYPLDGIVLRWEYHVALREGENTAPGVLVQDAPTSPDPERDIPEQLKTVPYFFQKDRRAFIYLNRVELNFHYEGSMEPTPYYGYADPNVTFAMRAHPYYGIDTFLDWTLMGTASEKRERMKDYLPLRLMEDSQGSAYVHPWEMPPACRETFFFDVFDIQALLKEMQPFPRMIYSFPTKYSFGKPFDRVSLAFGENLGILDGLPFSIDMGLIDIRFAKFTGR